MPLPNEPILLRSASDRPSRLVERCIYRASQCAAFICAAVVILIVTFVLYEAWPALTKVTPGRFFTDASWHPTLGRFRMWPMLVATLLVTIGSVIMTTPLGLMSAVFLHFYAPALLAALYRRVLFIVASVPSVVYGLWGITALVPLIARISPSGQGYSVLAGMLVISFMTLPIVALTIDTALAMVPREYLVAAAALGLSRRAMAWRVALPVAWRGVVAGVLLQTARVLGETMAVLMVCGNVVQVPRSLFSPVRLLTANIALEMGYAADEHRSALFVGGLWLLLVVGLMALVAHWLEKERSP